jgi:hypothetical protein
MDGLQQSVCRARRAREEAFEKPQKDFAAWSNNVASEAIALSMQSCGSYAELNKWMAIANRFDLYCLEGMLLGIEQMKANPV